MSNLKNQLANKAGGTATKKQPQTMQDWIKVMEPQIKKALPSVITAERFTRMALTAISTNPKLAECTPESFMGALMNAAQLGLEPNTPLGQAYLIPYGKSVQFQVGYKGLMELAQRSGQFKSIYAHTVYENDEFEVEYGLTQNIVHKPNFDDRGKPIGFYAVYKLTNGGENFVFMTQREVEEFGKAKSKTFNNGPWKTDFEAMAKKTVLKQLLKYAPIKVEFQREIAQDATIKTEIAEDMTEVPEEMVEAEYEVVEQNTMAEDADLKGTPFETK
ncbi:recombination and repair protein RecT [Andreesenia angusta]|uniref:Recombination and repair protein RecT n=1 Tax=Andreesenia angusta TaxID=39480 RepID=A0A1S1V6C9_9FIRM|nr:recombination protein RecT [Andreesenia angusta]OHW62191.1 recombination and repair protein RecT [Andreesenia angusta]